MQIHTDFDLGPHLWYKIGGTVKYLLEVTNKEDLLEAVAFIQKKKITNIVVLGLGANVIFPDGYFDGAVIHMQSKKSSVTLLPGKKVEAFAGEVLDTVINFSFDHALIGLEWAGGLPGTIGAAVRGNVGAFGTELQDVFHQIQALHLPDQKVVTFSKEQMQFAYRESFIKHHREYIILSVQLLLSRANASSLERAKEIYYANINYRKENHPNNFPNTGSVFKNITEKETIEKIVHVWSEVKELSEKKWHNKVSVGYLNKRLGFSGLQVGGAKVSEQHANFIDNVGQAKAKDVISIIEAIQKKYQETFGFIPEAEVEIVR